MVMSNRDRVDRGMGYLASGLGLFVDERMTAAASGRGDWIGILAARNPARHGGRRDSLADPRFLLRVVTEEWRVFKDHLSRVEQGFAAELRDAGNRWAHGDPFSDDDTYRTLDTMERLLTAVGAAEQASATRVLRRDLQQPAPGPPPPPAASHTAPPSGLAAERAGRGSWSRVTPADVVRAIEEYDQLGQDQFLASHGFRRATAYLLIYRGRSYDSKAILGVAYQFATGTPIGPHDFSGGAQGAAGVLRNLGFEIRNTRDSPARRAEAQPDSARSSPRETPSGSPGTTALAHSGGGLDGVDPQQSLLVLTCSGRKERGGRPPGPADQPAWPQDLADARTRVLATADADTAHLLPAWRRYTGTFYQHARPALADAVAAGRVVIISGGYGIARADEPIGWYDKILQLADWPAGLLETALISEARRCGTQTVVAFASSTTDYARLLRRTPWQQAGIDARLVTITGVTQGAMHEVPRRLGQAFAAFWNHQHDSYPPGTTTELLR
jgi:hypothetical protein